MAQESQPKTAFIMQSGLFEFNVMPFSLCNGLAMFQRLMQTMLAGFDKFSAVYVDDIIVFSKILSKMLKHLQLVFDRVKRAGLKIKLEKCQLARPDVRHVISNNEIKLYPKNLKTVQRFPVPQNVKALRSVQGSVSYYHSHFVRSQTQWQLPSPTYTLYN